MYTFNSKKLIREMFRRERKGKWGRVKIIT
jgi:hypothetical protein